MSGESKLSPAVANFDLNNSIYASGYTGGGLPAAPGHQVAVVTCMDARVDPYRALGLDLGQAHVIRNAGGVITNDVVRSLCLSQLELGTKEIVVIHHTKCGLAGLDEAAVMARIKANAGQQPPWSIHAFADVAEDTRQAVATLKASPYLIHTDNVYGFVHNVDTGRIEPV